MPDPASRLRTILSVSLALLAGAVFAVSITLLARRVASPQIGLDNSPAIVGPAPGLTITSTVDTSAPGLSLGDQRDTDGDSDDD